MSSNGTFSGDSLHHTDADPSPSPFYSSIHESNLAHRQYKAKQHQVGEVSGCGLGDIKLVDLYLFGVCVGVVTSMEVFYFD